MNGERARWRERERVSGERERERVSDEVGEVAVVSLRRGGAVRFRFHSECTPHARGVTPAVVFRRFISSPTAAGPQSRARFPGANSVAAAVARLVTLSAKHVM